MKQISELAKKGWEITITWQPDGFYIDAQKDTMKCSGYGNTLTEAVRDLVSYIYAGGRSAIIVHDFFYPKR